MSVVLVVLQPGNNCMSPDTSRMVLAAPSNQGVHQETRAVEMQAQRYDERAEGPEARRVALDSVRRPSPSIQVRCSTTKVGMTIDLGTVNFACSRFPFHSSGISPVISSPDHGQRDTQMC